MGSHGKQYTDAFEEAYRKGIFAANLAKINQHNVEHANGEHTWKMAVNQFADLTHDEFMAMNNHGLVGDEEELKKMVNDRPVAVAVDASPFQFYSSGILDCRSFHSLNHAVFAVGYNDGSDWIIKNSWGQSWGEQGYVRVGMGGNPCGVADYPAYAIAK